MSIIEQSLFIKALRKEPVDRTPAWIMRQAGRYLPEYREIRKKAGDFLTLCKTPELACEVTLQPLRRYPLDAAILFSDILTIPDAMGLGLHFIENEGPKFHSPLRTLQAIENLALHDGRRDLDYVFAAAKLIRREMPHDLPLIGFSGSPWTLACYMVEGGSSRDFKEIMTLGFLHPEWLTLLLEKLTAAVSGYLLGQIEAGVDCVMLFDTWGGILTPKMYQQYSLNPMIEIVKTLKAKAPQIPVIMFTKNGGQWLEAMTESGCDALGLDWTCDLAKARARVGHQVALQGNLHPGVLLTSPECIREQVRGVLQAYGQGSGHVFNLGHGITPDVPPEHVSVLLEAIKTYSSTKT